MNELINSQRKAIQYHIDKLEKATDPIEMLSLAVVIKDMEEKLNEMMKPKKNKL